MGKKPKLKSKPTSSPAGAELPTVMDLSQGDWKEVPQKNESAWDEKITDPLPKPPNDDEVEPEIAPIETKAAIVEDESVTVAIVDASELLELEEMSSSSTRAVAPSTYQHGGDPSSVILAIDGWLQNKEAIKRLLPRTNTTGKKAAKSKEGTGDTKKSAPPLKGRSLATALDACKTAEQRMALLPRFVQVCRTLAYAHSRGVVHLDLDEKSIVLGQMGETVIRNWNSAAVLKSGGALPGPPSSPIGFHISPERLGNAAPPHPSADIWSLGVLLYRILTGGPLFEESDSEMRRSLILGGEIIHPRQHEPRIPDSLAKLCLRALRRSPRRRLKDAETLGRLLEQTVGASVLLSPRDIPKVPSDKKNNKKKVVITSAVIVLALAAALFLISNLFRDKPTAGATKPNHITAEQEAAKKAQQEEALRLLQATVKSSLELAEEAEKSAAVERHHAATILAAASLLSNPAYPGSPHFNENFAAKNSEARELAASMLGRFHLSGASARYDILDTTDSGKDIAVWAVHPHAEAVYVGTEGGAVRRHDIGTWSTPEELGNLSSPIVTLETFTDGDRVIAVSKAGDAWIWDTKTGERKTRLSLGNNTVVAASLSFDGSVLATAHPKEGVKLWGTQRGTPLSNLRSHIGAVRALAYNPRRNRLAAGGDSGEIMIWQLPAERRHLLFQAHSKPVRTLAYSSDGSRLLSTSDDGTVRIWDTEKGQRLFSIKLGFTDVPVATWVPNEKSWLAVISSDGLLRILDWKHDLTLSQLDPLSGPVQFIAHSIDGGRMLTKGADGTVGIWRRSEGSLRNLFISSRNNDVVNDIAFSKDGAVMAAAGSNHVVRVWQNANPRSDLAFATKGESATETAVSSDGRRVAALTESGMLRSWLIDPTELSFKSASQTGRDRGLAFVPGKDEIAVGGADGVVRTLSAHNGKTIRTFSTGKKNGAVLDLTFSPDGKMTACLHENGQIILFDSEAGKKISSLGSDAKISYLGGFSQDGRKIAAGSPGQLLIFNTEKGQLTGTIPWKGDEITAATYATEGSYVAAAGGKRAGIWNSETLTPDLKLNMSDPLSTIAQNPAGQQWVFGQGNRVTVLPFKLLPGVADAQILLSQAEQAAGFTLDDLKAHTED